ncbi:unnamed protein product [Calicophoron daubneyi]|uniref:G-protein coupled receptors family 1 profile domain-containing protein n=1 Tax=Calicophoron daubneyi TaxID=300641 RepID=A0AAV2TS98_CALDB
MIHAAINYPSSVIFDLLEPAEQADNVCIVWVYSETAVCHAILLHLLGSSLDTYLRLLMPRWYSSSRGSPVALRLKLAAPWIVSLLQTSAQVFLGNPFPPSQLENGQLCTCPDVNFLILRTGVAFTLPMLISVIILFLAAHKLQQLSQTSCRQRYAEKSTDSDSTVMRWIGDNDVVEKNNPYSETKALSKECDIIAPRIKSEAHASSKNRNRGSQNDLYDSLRWYPIAGTPSSYAVSSAFLLSPTLTNVFKGQGSSSSDTGFSTQTTEENNDLISSLRTKEDRLTYGADSVNNNFTGFQSADEIKIVDHFCPQHGHVKLSLQPEKVHLETVEEKHPNELSRSLGLKNTVNLKTVVTISGTGSTAPLEVNCVDDRAKSISENISWPKNNTPVHMGCLTIPSEGATNQHLSESRQIRMMTPGEFASEKKAIKLNMITCALSIALWAPFITASLAHLLLSATNYSYLITVSTLTQFKWLSYATSIAYSFGYLLIDRNLCKAVLRLHKGLHTQTNAEFNYPDACTR